MNKKKIFLKLKIVSMPQRLWPRWSNMGGKDGFPLSRGGGRPTFNLITSFIPGTKVIILGHLSPELAQSN